MRQYLYWIVSLSILSCDTRSHTSEEVTLIQQFYPNGQIEYSYEAKDSIPHGKLVSYYPDGKLKSSMHFNNGLEDGLAMFYYVDGKLKRKVNYRSGRQDGTLEQYYESGNIEYIGEYYNNLKIGKHLTFHDNGSNIPEIEAKYVIVGDTSVLNAEVIRDGNGIIVSTTPDFKAIREGSDLIISLEFQELDSLRVVYGDFDKFFVCDDTSQLDTVYSPSGHDVRISMNKLDTIRGVIQNYERLLRGGLIDSSRIVFRNMWFSFPPDSLYKFHGP